ncbi:MAG: ABC transporter permease [Acidobacteria bacterium]|nr:ABC transporter permease [Acidobacteriota bacterium]
MKAYDLVELASRNLRESLLRNGLTTAGIAVGVASLVAMLSLGVGLQELASARLSRSGLFDTIVVSPRRSSRSWDSEEQNRLRGMDTFRSLDEQARREMEKIASVVEVQPEIRFVAEVRLAERSRVTTVGGLSPSARDSDAFENLQGKFFTNPVAPEAILQIELARDLDSREPASLIGKELIVRYAERQSLPPEESGGTSQGNALEEGDEPEAEEYGFTLVRREQPLRIVGLIEEEPFGGLRAISRARVFIPTQLAEQLNIVESSDLQAAVRDAPAGKAYATLMVRVANPSQVTAVQETIDQMGFRTFSIMDATRSLQRFFAILDLFLGIFGSLALAVASLGIINTLVMAVLERRREIGILKALGASDRDVKKLFFAEAGAMGFFGGIAGVALGSGIGLAINIGTRIYLEQRNLPPETVWSAPPWLMGAAIVFAVAVSLAAGLYPAMRAAKLDPVQALRYE